jgi:hypothetical protein
MPKQDFYITWKSRNGMTNEHRVRIYDGLGDYRGKQIVLVTEEPNSTGVSVTNGCTEIATELKRNGQFDAESVFVEHYEREIIIKTSKSFATEHDLTLTYFRWDASEGRYHQPHWRPLPTENFYEITGELLE